ERRVVVKRDGSTETRVHGTWRRLRERDLGRAGSVVGRPLPDLALHLLDARGRPVPIGVPGEIHVGGAGVARGYLGRPELTAERFVPDAWSAEPGARLYRAGDLVRWRPDGDLEYLGRIDHQVKIRGSRIELGEVESALREHPAVGEVVVVPWESAPGDRRLAAYLVAGDGGPLPEPVELRGFLGGRLPEHMIPTAFVALPAL